MASRRALDFKSFHQVMPDVDRLIDGGHVTVGNWTLAQICNHLSSSLIWSVDGFPVTLPWIVRATVGRVLKGRILKTRRLASNVKVPSAMLPKPGLDARAEVETLRAAIAHYVAHPEKRALNPIFGKLTPAQADELNLIHISHHLSFALPASAAVPTV